jgi:hypothetical protein
MPEDVAPFRELYGVPDDHEPIGAVAIGYSAEPPGAVSGSPKTRGRRAVEDVIHHGRW